MKYYIISLKWTYPDDAVFTFWQAHNSGYTWYKEQAGLYSEKAIKKDHNYYNNGVDTLAVSQETVDKLWITAEYEKKIHEFLLNSIGNRELLLLAKKELQGCMSHIFAHELKILPKEDNVPTMPFHSYGQKGTGKKIVYHAALPGKEYALCGRFLCNPVELNTSVTNHLITCKYCLDIINFAKSIPKEYVLPERKLSE
jgi:hypothetical protein